MINIFIYCLSPKLIEEMDARGFKRVGKKIIQGAEAIVFAKDPLLPLPDFAIDDETVCISSNKLTF